MTDPRRAAVVQAALAEVGPGRIADYWASCGISPAPDPRAKWGQWCGVFALACLHAAGVALDVKWKTGLGFINPCHLPITTSPRPGDILYSPHYQHHGVVESYDPVTGVLTSIEGNTPTVAHKTHTDVSAFTFYSIAPLLGERALPAPGEVPPVGAGGGDAQGLILGVDVSHHQLPSAVDYATLAKTRRFVIARASYGARPDETFAEHVHRAQDAGLIIGAYAFFRPGDAVPDQLDAFGAAVDAAGMGPGWLPPALDVEQNPTYDGPVTTDRYAPARELCEAWRVQYGAVMVYTNPAMWGAIGSPTWLTEYLLWISHYDVEHPTTPFSMTWQIWQLRVGPLPGICPGPMDQNVARSLPLLKDHDPAAPLLLTVDWDSLRADRDAMVREEDA